MPQIGRGPVTAVALSAVTMEWPGETTGIRGKGSGKGAWREAAEVGVIVEAPVTAGMTSLTVA